MDVKVLKVGEELPEVVEIRCHRINAQVREIDDERNSMVFER